MSVGRVGRRDSDTFSSYDGVDGRIGRKFHHWGLSNIKRQTHWSRCARGGLASGNKVE